jgi:hypothetical protein
MAEIRRPYSVGGGCRNAIKKYSCYLVYSKCVLGRPEDWSISCIFARFYWRHCRTIEAADQDQQLQWCGNVSNRISTLSLLVLLLSDQDEGVCRNACFDVKHNCATFEDCVDQPATSCTGEPSSAISIPIRHAYELAPLACLILTLLLFV